MKSFTATHKHTFIGRPYMPGSVDLVLTITEGTKPVLGKSVDILLDWQTVQSIALKGAGHLDRMIELRDKLNAQIAKFV